MQCPTCKAEIADSSSFCEKCGSAVPAGGASPGAGAAGGASEASADDPNALLGKTIAGKYRITRLLGEGGMGCVYVAEQMLGTKARNVAIKTLHKHLSEDEKIRERFQREVGTVAELEHPNTIQVYDYGAMPDGLLYIVMEFVQGKSIAAVLEKEGHIDPARVRKIVQQVGGSLEEAHAHGIVHRDLKPDNVVLTDRAGQKDFVKVLDFGIAKRSQETDPNEKKLTQQGMVLGTPQYMAPEQFLGKSLDARADIYAMGVMAYEMLTGQLPFAANTAWEWATQHMTLPPRAIETQPNGAAVPEPMRRAIRRALEKDPAARFATMHEMVEAFCAEGSQAQPAPQPMQGAPGLANAAANAGTNAATNVGANTPGRGKTQMGEPIGPGSEGMVAPARTASGTSPGTPMQGPMNGFQGTPGPMVPFGAMGPGAMVPGAMGPGVPPYRAAVPAYPANASARSNGNTGDAPDGGRKGLLIAAAIVGVLTLGCVAAAVLWPSSGPRPIPGELADTNTTTTTTTATAAPTTPDPGGSGGSSTEPSAAPLGGGGGGGGHANGGGGGGGAVVPPHHPDAGKPNTPPTPTQQPTVSPTVTPTAPPTFPPIPTSFPTIIPTIIPPPAQNLPPAVQAACNEALAARRRGIPNPSAEQQCRNGGGGSLLH